MRSLSPPPLPTVDAARRRSAQVDAAIADDPPAYRVLTGDRPTGPLHLGHYFGTLANRIRLQQLGVDLLVVIADYQTLTDRDAPAGLADDVLGLVADYVAAGIDPSRATIFAHSQIPALNQLVVPFLSLVSAAELTRNPTVKEEHQATGGRTMSGLQLVYPVPPAADRLFCHADAVPVGRDQLPHLETTRAVARRFNERYAPDGPCFREPEALLTEASRLPGLDGQKMSKSRRNGVALRMTADQTAAAIRRAPTDGERRITYEPERRPGVASLLTTAGICLGREPAGLAEEIGDGGASRLKAIATEAVNERFAPLRAARVEVAADPGALRDILRAGAERAETVAAQILDDVRRLMHTVY